MALFYQLIWKWKQNFDVSFVKIDEYESQEAESI